MKIKWFSEASFVLANRFCGELRQQVRGTCEEIVPPPLGFKLSENPGTRCLLLGFREPGQLGHRLLEYLAHTPDSNLVLLPQPRNRRQSLPSAARIRDTPSCSRSIDVA